MIFIDFNTLVLKISNISTIADGYISAIVITSGILGNNKSVLIVPGEQKRFKLPVLTEKDKKSIELDPIFVFQT